MVKRIQPKMSQTKPQPADDRVMPVLAGVDSINLSCKPHISQAVREKLDEEKTTAQLAAKVGGVHCPEWLGARVLPNGAKGYSYLLETEDFTVKVALEHMTQWPGVYLELRSYFLHTHPDGPQGACEESLCWVRSQLFYDQDDLSVQEQVSFSAAHPSRVDLHIDWQGGFVPTLEAGEAECFIKPRRVKWHPYCDGTRCTGYRFGSGGDIVARLYNKTLECRDSHNEWYSALLEIRSQSAWLGLWAAQAGYLPLAFAALRQGTLYDPEQEVWRLEFQLRNEGIKGFKLNSTPELGEEGSEEELQAEVEADLSAEDLPHIGTLPKLFAHLDALFQHLSLHWLRLVRPPCQKGTQIRSRWPLDPTWEQLRANFARLAQTSPLGEEAGTLLRGARYSGRARLLRRMALGVVNSLEVEDASVASASLAALQRYAEQAAQQEAARREREATRARVRAVATPNWKAALEGQGDVSEDGVDTQAARIRHRIQMLLGIFAAHGVLPLEYKPADQVMDLLAQHIEALDQEAVAKGGMRALLDQHFSKVYKVPAASQTVL